jgi:hypothetical protein
MLLGLVWAQEQDGLLQSYSLAIDSLNLAVNSMSTDTIKSRDELKRASDALRPMAAESSSPALIAALENTFTRAQTTIQNQSQTDLSVQVSVIKGGFQRLLYEAAINSANQGNVELTQQRLSRLASDLNLPSETQTALAGGDLGQLFTSFEKGVAQIIRSKVDSVSGILATDKGLAYQTLAEAYSAYLPIQDSPRADTSSNALFTQAFSALVSDDNETLNASLTQLSSQMTQLENAAAGVSAQTIEATPVEVAPVEATPVEATVEATPVETTTEVTPVESTPVETAPVEATPVQTASPVSNDILRSLQPYGLPASQQTSLAEHMNQRGFISPNLVLDSLLANSARAAMELQAGQAASARGIFSDIHNTYKDLLEPIISNANPSVHNTTTSLLSNLSTAPSLRVQDAVTASQQLGEVGKVLDSTPPSNLQGWMSTLTNFWTGWTRPIVMIVLGLFAFVPLYLLFLAFGGGNRNWQLIGYALFLLLVPVIYEGISYILSSIATPLNMPALDVLSRFSMFQNTFTQLLWVLLTALAIGLATAGLYGICVQFGLLGKRVEDPATTMLEAPASDPEMVAAKTTSFEWDEEF